MISVKASSYAIREVLDLNLIHPIRRRNLYPNNPHHFFDPSELDELNSAIHFTAFDGDIHFGCVTLIREPATIAIFGFDGSELTKHGDVWGSVMH